MPDGSERKAKSWETSPLDVAKDVSKSLSERVVIAKVHLLFLFYFYFFTHSIPFILNSRWTANCGIWKDHLKSLASSSYLILNTQKVKKKKKNTDVFPWKVVYTVYFYIKEKRFSGILLRMFWERLPRDIMVVIYVSVLQLMMDFFTRWLLRNGEFPRLLVIWFL